MRLLVLICMLVLPLASQARSVLTEPATLDTPSGRLFGTLVLPGDGRSPMPVALLVAGSGPTDRNGNNPLARNDSLRKLAAALAKMGVASLRYDKRGVAASLDAGRDERTLSVEGYVDDLIAWSHRLQADQRLGPQFFIGHSEGALVASLAAAQVDPAALISIAGSGRPIDELLRQQLQGKLGPDLLANSSYLIDELKAGRTNEQVPEPLKVLFRPSVQPYLISLFRHDPATAMAATRCPTLIIQGSRDAQVSLADASALHAARPEAELAVIAGMNHVLRIVAPDSPAPLASYNEPQLPLAHELLVRIETFLLDTGLLPSSR
ncbi:MAG TPA: alpha/beta hydrolase [Pseudomonas sp.]|nr:alpha/beta hydrolase [Pseudomonas sp.]